MGEISDEELGAAVQSAGYYYEVAGKAWNRAVEAVHFYVALKRAGLPEDEAVLVSGRSWAVDDSNVRRYYD